MTPPRYQLPIRDYGFAQYMEPKKRKRGTNAKHVAFVPSAEQVDIAIRRICGVFRSHRTPKHIFRCWSVNPTAISKILVHRVHDRGNVLGNGIKERQITVLAAVARMIATGQLTVEVDECGDVIVDVEQEKGMRTVRRPRYRNHMERAS